MSRRNSTFNQKVRSAWDHLGLEAPCFHLLPYVTGGLKRLIKNIHEENVPELPDFGFHTDKDGQFRPRGDCILGMRYDVKKLLSNKGQSAVLVLAEDLFADRRTVVIKVLHAKLYKLGSQESQIIWRLSVADPLNHSQTVRLLNTLTFDCHYCMVFEPLLPDPITKVFQQIPHHRVMISLRRVFMRLLTSVGFLHQQNLIHTDLKPDNILLKHENDLDSVHIVDFGNAIHYVHHEVSLYYTDFELQTPLYRAPEVMFGMPFGTEIDMWSLGCTLSEMYTGKPLFAGTSKEQIVEQMVKLLGPMPVKLFRRGKYYLELKKYTADVDQADATLVLMDHLQCTDFNFAHLLTGLLKYNPDKRLTAYEAAQHPFFASHFPLAFLMPQVSGSVPGYPSIEVSSKSYPHKPKVPAETKKKQPSSLDLLRMGTKFEEVDDRTIVIERPIPRHPSRLSGGVGVTDEVADVKSERCRFHSGSGHDNKTTQDYLENSKPLASLMREINKEQDRVERDFEMKTNEKDIKAYLKLQKSSPFKRANVTNSSVGSSVQSEEKPKKNIRRPLPTYHRQSGNLENNSRYSGPSSVLYEGVTKQDRSKQVDECEFQDVVSKNVQERDILMISKTISHTTCTQKTNHENKEETKMQLTEPVYRSLKVECKRQSEGGKLFKETMQVKPFTVQQRDGDAGEGEGTSRHPSVRPTQQQQQMHNETVVKRGRHRVPSQSLEDPVNVHSCSKSQDLNIHVSDGGSPQGVPPRCVHPSKFISTSDQSYQSASDQIRSPNSLSQNRNDYVNDRLFPTAKRKSDLSPSAPRQILSSTSSSRNCSKSAVEDVSSNSGQYHINISSELSSGQKRSRQISQRNLKPKQQINPNTPNKLSDDDDEIDFLSPMVDRTEGNVQKHSGCSNQTRKETVYSEVYRKHQPQTHSSLQQDLNEHPSLRQDRYSMERLEKRKQNANVEKASDTRETQQEYNQSKSLTGPPKKQKIKSLTLSAPQNIHDQSNYVEQKIREYGGQRNQSGIHKVPKTQTVMHPADFNSPHVDYLSDSDEYVSDLDLPDALESNMLPTIGKQQQNVQRLAVSQRSLNQEDIVHACKDRESICVDFSAPKQRNCSVPSENSSRHDFVKIRRMKQIKHGAENVAGQPDDHIDSSEDQSLVQSDLVHCQSVRGRQYVRQQDLGRRLENLKGTELQQKARESKKRKAPSVSSGVSSKTLKMQEFARSEKNTVSGRRHKSQHSKDPYKFTGTPGLKKEPSAGEFEKRIQEKRNRHKKKARKSLFPVEDSLSEDSDGSNSDWSSEQLQYPGVRVHSSRNTAGNCMAHSPCLGNCKTGMTNRPRGKVSNKLHHYTGQKGQMDEDGCSPFDITFTLNEPKQ